MLNLPLFLSPERDIMYYKYYCLPPREQFSYSVVWWGIVPDQSVRALYLTRQHYRRTGPSGEGNNRIMLYYIIIIIYELFHNSWHIYYFQKCIQYIEKGTKMYSVYWEGDLPWIFSILNWLIDWLIDWHLMSTLAVLKSQVKN